MKGGQYSLDHILIKFCVQKTLCSVLLFLLMLTDEIRRRFGLKKSNYMCGYTIWKIYMKEYMLALTEQKMYYGKPYFEDVMGHVCY